MDTPKNLEPDGESTAEKEARYKRQNDLMKENPIGKALGEINPVALLPAESAGPPASPRPSEKKYREMKGGRKGKRGKKSKRRSGKKRSGKKSKRGKKRSGKKRSGKKNRTKKY